MKFSQVNVMERERTIVSMRQRIEGEGIFEHLFNLFLFRRNPTHTFTFNVPLYIHERAETLCRDFSDAYGTALTIRELARILYLDFIEYVKSTNDIHNVHKRLKARDVSPATIRPYQTEEVYPGVIFKEERGHKRIQTSIKHLAALRGEQLLFDMKETYKDHTFTLENVLEIVFCNFIDDYRKGIIKNHFDKIAQYI